jgi:(p)ppGpp synthase/HD superfamily hydrolase
VEKIKIMELTSERQSFLINNAKQYALTCHNDTNHKYGNFPYSYHLQSVFDFGLKYCHLLEDAVKINNALATCWTHDVIEDCRQTYNDVKKVCGQAVAEATFALTNEKGKTRKERANSKYYIGIKQNEIATFVKICDRLANVEHSKFTHNNMLDIYRQENFDFKHFLFCEKFRKMFNDLEMMFFETNE